MELAPVRALLAVSAERLRVEQAKRLSGLLIPREGQGSGTWVGEGALVFEN